MTSQTNAIRITNLVKRYGQSLAVDDLSLSVRRGSMFGFLGPNGSGKSTTIGCLTGLLDPTAGEVEILGEPIYRRKRRLEAAHGRDARDAGAVRPLYAHEFLAFVARMYGLEEADRAPPRYRTAGRAGIDRHPEDAGANTAPACASAWPSPPP